MLRGMSPQLFRLWQAYAELEPFDERRGDLRSAQIVSTMMNFMRDPKTHPEPYTLEDVLFKFDEEPKPIRTQTWEEQKDMLMAIAYAFAGAPRED